MLKILLMLALGGGSRAESAGVDSAALDDALAKGGAALDDVEAKLVLDDLAELWSLGDELGDRLVGAERDDFEDRLAELFDEDRFAEFLGRFALTGLQIIERPSLARVLEARVESPSPRAESLTARLIADFELFADIDVLKNLSGIGAPSRHIETIGILVPGHTTLGRDLISGIYDPAATERQAAWAESFVRLIARMLVVRHLDASGGQAPSPYVQGLFEKSNHDVTQLGDLFAAYLSDEGLRAERIKYQQNRRNLARALRSRSSADTGDDLA